jgi:hypothetical protein
VCKPLQEANREKEEVVMQEQPRDDQGRFTTPAVNPDADAQRYLEMSGAEPPPGQNPQPGMTVEPSPDTVIQTQTAQPTQPAPAPPEPEELPKRYTGEDGKEYFLTRENGQDVYKSLDEVLQGNMRDADYRHKTQELAELRRQVEDERIRVEAERRRYQGVDEGFGPGPSSQSFSRGDGRTVPVGEQPNRPTRPYQPLPSFDEDPEGFQRAQQDMALRLAHLERTNQELQQQVQYSSFESAKEQAYRELEGDPRFPGFDRNAVEEQLRQDAIEKGQAYADSLQSKDGYELVYYRLHTKPTMPVPPAQQHAQPAIPQRQTPYAESNRSPAIAPQAPQIRAAETTDEIASEYGKFTDQSQEPGNPAALQQYLEGR